MQLHIEGQPHRVVKGVLNQVGVNLRHHIGQQLNLTALKNDNARCTLHGAPDFCQTEQPRLAILVQSRRLIRSRAALADGIRHHGEQLSALALQRRIEKHHCIQFTNVLVHGYSSSFFNSWGLVVIIR